MKQMEEIRGKNIVLRPLKLTDLELVRSWRNQEDIRISFISQDIIDPEQQQMWYQSYLQKDDDLMFMIEETNQLHRCIGTAALYKIDVNEKAAEFGRLMIGDAKSRGTGFGSEAVLLLCNFGFTVLDLDQIDLLVLKENEKAVNLYKKCGFQETGVTIKSDKHVIHMRLIRGHFYDKIK